MDNTIEINDYTFPTRLKSFIQNIEVNDFCGQEEKEYLLYSANKMIEYQKEKSIKNSDKFIIDYLERTK